MNDSKHFDILFSSFIILFKNSKKIRIVRIKKPTSYGKNKTTVVAKMVFSVSYISKLHFIYVISDLNKTFFFYSDGITVFLYQGCFSNKRSIGLINSKKNKEIGRASCREKGKKGVGEVACEHK